MKPCEACGRSHHVHTENDLSNCLMWANDDNRKLRAEVARLRELMTDVYRAAIAVPVVYRGDAIRWAKLCDRMLDELGEDPLSVLDREGE